MQLYCSCIALARTALETAVHKKPQRLSRNEELEIGSRVGTPCLSLTFDYRKQRLNAQNTDTDSKTQILQNV